MDFEFKSEVIIGKLGKNSVNLSSDTTFGLDFSYICMLIDTWVLYI